LHCDWPKSRSLYCHRKKENVMAIRLHRPLLTNNISLGAASSFLLHPIKAIFLICKRGEDPLVKSQYKPSTIKSVHQGSCSILTAVVFSPIFLYNQVSLVVNFLESIQWNRECKCFKIYTMKQRMLTSITISWATWGKLVWSWKMFSQTLFIKLPYGLWVYNATFNNIFCYIVAVSFIDGGKRLT